MPPYRKDSQTLRPSKSLEDAEMMCIPGEPDLSTRPVPELAKWNNWKRHGGKPRVAKNPRPKPFDPFN